MDGPVGDRITGTGGEGCRCKEEREHRACSSRGVEQQLDAAPEEQPALQEAAVQRPERPRRGCERKALRDGTRF